MCNPIQRISESLVAALLEKIESDQEHNDRISRILRNGPFEYDQRGLISKVKETE